MKSKNLILACVLLISSLALNLSFATTSGPSTPTLPQTVSSVDIEKYMGKWYEIAKFPNWFQKKCGATTAEYTLLTNGKVAVKNSCKNINNPNITKIANGTAYVVDHTTNAKLKVSFVPFFQRWGLFAGDYWILALDEDYSYALVGGPDRNFLWILSRTSTLDPATVEELKEIAVQNGFDISRLVETPVWE